MEQQELKPIKGYSADEQETTITFSRVGDECILYTSDNTVLTKMKGMMAKSGQYRVNKVLRAADTGAVTGYEFTFPKKFLSFRAGLELSAEEKASRAERMRALKAKQQD